MKNIIYLSTLLFIFSCKTVKNTEIVPQKNINSIYKEWILKNSNQQEKNISINFKENEGSISGFSGCNRYTAMFKTSGNSLVIQNISSTKMYCPNIKEEQNFLNLIKEVDSYKLTDSNLILMKNNLELLNFTIGN